MPSVQRKADAKELLHEIKTFQRWGAQEAVQGAFADAQGNEQPVLGTDRIGGSGCR
jgi:hypothetical protein